jgi:enoyl-CoA hydratase/carnithine racemase
LDESVLTGELYFAPQAVSLGLIDEIGSMEYAISVADAIVPEPATLVNPLENISQKSHTMKFNAAWKAIAGFFKMNESDIESQELTFDQVQQINDRLDVLTLKNVELEQSVSTAESALSAEQTAHAITKESLRVMSEQDAGIETGAVKEIDHIEGDGPEPVYAHDKIADQYCG